MKEIIFLISTVASIQGLNNYVFPFPPFQSKIFNISSNYSKIAYLTICKLYLINYLPKLFTELQTHVPNYLYTDNSKHCKYFKLNSLIISH